MPPFIVRFEAELTELNTRFPLVLPLSAEDVALRVLCRYDVTELPPPPIVQITTITPEPDTTPLDTTIRNFMLIPLGEPLPTDFAKYIGHVPFGADKQGVFIIETTAITPVRGGAKPKPKIEKPEKPVKPVKPGKPEKPSHKPKPKPKPEKPPKQESKPKTPEPPKPSPKREEL